MNATLFEPLDPVRFGRGTSIGSTGLAEATAVPYPTTTAGMVRSRALDRGLPWTHEMQEDARTIQVHGPLGVVLNPKSEVTDWWAPAPADAVLFHTAGQTELLPRRPVCLPEGTRVGPDTGSLPVALRPPRPDKPWREAPPFWRWREELEPWLCGAPIPHLRGLQGPALHERTHVAMRPGLRVPEAGALFTLQQHSWSLPGGERLALSLRCDRPVPHGISQAGGERRFVRWAPDPTPWPAIPEAVLQSAEAGAVRLLLLTPAAFTAGHRPDWLLTQRLETELVAQVHGRPLVISGWDFERRAPKPTRRLVPAGAVFFLRLGGAPAARRAWASSLWLRPVSDTPTDRAMGLGLAALGTWDGDTPPLEQP